LDEDDLHLAQDFRGDANVGYKVALCQRDIAIYGGILFAGLAFGALRKSLKPLPIGLWFLLGVLPVALVWRRPTYYTHHLYLK